MKSKASLLILPLVFGLATSAASAEVMGRFEELALHLKPASETGSGTGYVFPLQVLRVVATLSNPTSRAVAGHDAIDPDFPLISFHIACPGAGFVEFSLANYAVASCAVDVRELAPGFSKSVIVNMWSGSPDHRGPGEAYFPEPGDYLVKASLKMVGKPQFIESNVLPVTVREPSAEEYDAWRLLKDKTEENVAKSDLPGGAIPFTRPQRCDPSSWRWKLYADVIEHFPGTSYADYARYTIGMRCCAEDESALALLEEVGGKHEFPMRDEVLHHLVNLHVRKRNMTKARVYCSELLLSYPESHLTKSAMGRVHRGARGQ